MGKTKLQLRKPALMEVILLGVGLLLLSAWFQLRAGQEMESEAAVQAFYAANSSAGPADQSPGHTPTFVSNESPDMSLWSEKRIADHHASLAAGGHAPLAVLSIDQLNIEVPVYDGADEHNLNRGVARVRGTARVGADGNLGIAGHRDGFFRGLKDIESGDTIQLNTAGEMVTYQVVSIQIVNPEDVGVLAPTDERTLTLVTCFPFYFVGDAPQRYIVKAVAQQILKT